MQTKTLAEQLTTVQAERDSLLLQQQEVCSLESTEELLSRVASVSQERDQLQEVLEALREERQQFRAELEDRMETVCDHTQGYAELQKPTLSQNNKKKIS